MIRISVAQMQSGIDPDANALVLEQHIAAAAEGGAVMLFTPEMTGLLDRDRQRGAENIRTEDDDVVLSKAKAAAKTHAIWVAIGSLALNTGEGKWSNRSLLINPHGEIAARYDKMHMFDVDLASGESWRESNAYRAGSEVVTAETPVGRLGLTICYDLRFPALFEELGQRKCDVIAIPAAFTVPTGKAHWHVMQRARAIEASAFVVAAAQVGKHPDGRVTYGHSLVVDPWGQVLLDMGGEAPGLGFADIDLGRIAEVRAQVPSLANRRDIPKSPAP
ncbi:carbon-nitrogen hydrolase family protein [Parerythrobacter aestuarii]|uniref:carbon-nitrogen hydrolase family protein n=1 Tax=Parerythrobacter aestuarii TaxID=3020909 RepID=UPI0024DE7B70|nr:carbon-nitrogen hydrolase family protein [Parerythrobacter aestuarii]